MSHTLLKILPLWAGLWQILNGVILIGVLALIVLGCIALWKYIRRTGPHTQQKPRIERGFSVFMACVRCGAARYRPVSAFSFSGRGDSSGWAPVTTLGFSGSRSALSPSYRISSPACSSTRSASSSRV